MTEREVLQLRIKALATQQVRRRIAIRRVIVEMDESVARHQREIDNLKARLLSASGDDLATVVSMMDRKRSNRYGSANRRQA